MKYRLFRRALGVLYICYTCNLWAQSPTPFPVQRIDSALSEDLTTLQIIAPYKAQLSETLEHIIAYTDAPLTRKKPEYSLARWLTFFMYQEANEFAQKHHFPKADAALMGLGGIRSALPAGAITIGNIFEVMPFENTLVIVALKAQDIKAMLALYLKYKVYVPSYGITLRLDNDTIAAVKIGDKTLNEQETYYIATGNYWAEGGDKMTFFTEGTPVNTHKKLRDLYIKHFAIAKEIRKKDLPAPTLSIK